MNSVDGFEGCPGVVVHEDVFGRSAALSHADGTRLAQSHAVSKAGALKFDGGNLVSASHGGHDEEGAFESAKETPYGQFVLEFKRPGAAGDSDVGDAVAWSPPEDFDVLDGAQVLAGLFEGVLELCDFDACRPMCVFGRGKRFLFFGRACAVTRFVLGEPCAEFAVISEGDGTVCEVVGERLEIGFGGKSPCFVASCGDSAAG